MARKSDVAEQRPEKAEVLTHLFQPITIRGLTIKNRIAWAPTGVSFSSDNKWATSLGQRYIDFQVARAKGGVGLIVMSGRGFGRMESPYRQDVVEKSIAEFSELMRLIHAEGVKTSVQLSHSGRQVDSKDSTYEPVAASALQCPATKTMPRALTTAEVEELIERHIQGAAHARTAGFDMIEIKACHGYLLSGFLSPHSNRRTDRFGGDLAQRATMVVEIIKGIRRKVPDVIVCVRFNGADNFEGGLTPDDSKALARIFQDAGADLLHVSASVYGAYPVIIPPVYMPHGCFLPLAEGIKKAVNIPVIGVGRITDPHLGECALENGQCDIVAFGRPFWADPAFPLKASRGEFDEIRPCIGCNQGCQDRVRGLDSTCLVNPTVGREKEAEAGLIPVSMPKKVMVVGGGPAGVETAIVAAQRGHRVTLYEEKETLGGQWQLAAIPPDKQEYVSVIEYRKRQLDKLGVKVKLGTKVSGDVIGKEKPDVVVVATGAVPLIPAIPGIEKPNVTNAWDVLLGRSTVGNKVLVIGGGEVGLETAHLLADKGKKVTVVEMMEYVARDMGPTQRWHLRHKLADKKVEIFRLTKVNKISDEGIVVEREGKEETWTGFDNIVLAIGSCPRNELEGVAKKQAKEVYVIGDAAKPRNALYAIREGFETGLKI